MLKPIISADSHVIEPPGTYIDRIDRKFKDRAPRMVRDQKLGDVFVIDGMNRPLVLGLVAAAGKSAEELALSGGRFEEMHRGGWDPKARMADQDRDGISAEVLYASVGMFLCNHPDFDYKKACFDAYNLWLAEFCAAYPNRLIGAGSDARWEFDRGRDRRPAQDQDAGVSRRYDAGEPAVSDYDDPIYDPFYEAATALELPLSFHILTGKQDKFIARGPRLNFLSVDRSRLPGS